MIPEESPRHNRCQNRNFRQKADKLTRHSEPQAAGKPFSHLQVCDVTPKYVMLLHWFCKQAIGPRRSMEIEDQKIG
jgi:hypothetical protein